MVHLVRNSVGWAVGQIVMLLVLWMAIFAIPAMFLLESALGPQTISAWWWAAVGGGLLLCWAVHSRAAWRRLYDRSPQIEVHPTFLRATQLQDDILWKNVRHIEWRAVRSGGMISDSGLVLEVADKGSVWLDLVGLDTEGPQLETLAYDALMADVKRRRAGEPFDPAQEATAPREPVPTQRDGAEDLGEQVERFGPGADGLFLLCFGTAGLLGVSALVLSSHLKHPEEPIAGVLIPLIATSLLLWLPMIVFGVKFICVRLVLHRKGLQFVGLWGCHTLRYSDIHRTTTVTSDGRPTSFELMLHDSQVVKLRFLKDIGAAGQRLDELRRQAGHAEKVDDSRVGQQFLSPSGDEQVVAAPTRPAEDPIESNGGQPMRSLVFVLALIAGCAALYFGFHQMIGKAPFPFAEPDAAKAMGGLCTVAFLACALIAGRMGKRPDTDS